VHVERDQTRAVLTLCDPERLNPLSAGLMVRLQAHVMDLTADPSLRTIVITGQDPAFCAGGDLDMIESGATAIQTASDPSDTTDAWRWTRRQFGGLVRTVTSADKIFVAAVNGAAAGVGLAFALACDVIIASERAVLVPAFGRLGLVPEVGTSWLLTRRLGYHSAMALYITGRQIDAAGSWSAAGLNARRASSKRSCPGSTTSPSSPASRLPCRENDADIDISGSFLGSIDQAHERATRQAPTRTAATRNAVGSIARIPTQQVTGTITVGTLPTAWW